MRASRNDYGSNSFFQSYITIIITTSRNIITKVKLQYFKIIIAKFLLGKKKDSVRKSWLASLRAFCSTLWIMRLISLEVISRNYTPIILWLQEVDEQVRTDSGVKAGGFLQTMRKFNTYFYIEVLRMVLPLLKALVHGCRMLSLIFAKPRMLLLAQKFLPLSQGMIPGLTVYEMKLCVLQKRTMLLMIQNCQDHEKFPHGLMNLQMPSFMQMPKIIIDSYNTKCWIPWFLG